MKRKLYRRAMWGGFCDGRIHLWRNKPVGGQTHLAIFTRRSDARAEYVDVRRIMVTEVPAKRGKP